MQVSGHEDREGSFPARQRRTAARGTERGLLPTTSGGTPVAVKVPNSHAADPVVPREMTARDEQGFASNPVLSHIAVSGEWITSTACGRLARAGPSMHNREIAAQQGSLHPDVIP
jgi:hypothetical protein